jgi:N-acetylmuramoyl-L-alanine amidase
VSEIGKRRPDSPVATEFIASPNHNERRGYARPDAIVLHYTGMASGAAALARLCDPASEVSAHYFVGEDGAVVQLVGEERRAWHAGVGVWKGARDLNSASIGVEIANPGHGAPGAPPPPFPEAQIAALVALLRDIVARRAIAPERILAHSDVAPARKRDPGERFPWDALARAGIGHWTAAAPLAGGGALSPGEAGARVSALQAMLALYGYGIEVSGVYDADTRDVVAAFQRHFRPARVDGAADSSTIETLRALLAGLHKA